MTLSKIMISLAVVAATAFSARAVEPTLDARRTASNYYAYPHPELPLDRLSAAPAGYEPFHIEHYGRHGSRWHIGQWVYRQPIDLLRGAERDGKLTERGHRLMEYLRAIELEARGHDGELTALGAEQHRGIARRMTANFPEIFGTDARIIARSTDVVRCILSMENELIEFSAFNPSAEITSDASKSTVRILNYDDTTANRIHEAVYPMAMREVTAAYNPDYEAFIMQIVSDPQYAADSVNTRDLFNSIFRIAANAQSHKGQIAPYDLFTQKQLDDKWRFDNAEWFLRYGNTKLTDGTGPMRQRYLLRDIIDSADSAIVSPRHGANMRFGHEVALMPLAVVMELDSLGVEINDLTKVADRWRNYEIFPMASNIQMVFYRPAGGSYTPDDVLVKVMLNERETALPVSPVQGRYYRWSDLRRHYLDRLGSEGGKFAPDQPY